MTITRSWYFVHCWYFIHRLKLSLTLNQEKTADYMFFSMSILHFFIPFENTWEQHCTLFVMKIRNCTLISYMALVKVITVHLSLKHERIHFNKRIMAIPLETETVNVKERINGLEIFIVENCETITLYNLLQDKFV